MLRAQNISVPLDYTEESLRALILKKFRLSPGQLTGITLVRRSVDARNKDDIHFVLTLDLSLKDENSALKKNRGLSPAPQYTLPPLSKSRFSQPPLVVGAGPAGLFAALTLARAGAAPVLIERGKSVEERTRDVARMSESGILSEESNVQFGEGGAGAFSDGKLTCGIQSPWIREILLTFVSHGAPESILTDQLPHIGTDRLKGVVASIRREIISLGGTVLFETRLDKLIIREGRVEGVAVCHDGETREILTNTVLLCTGHSARDTVRSLFDDGVLMAQKPFAIGVRIEHPRILINRAQFGAFAEHPRLGAASYKLNIKTGDGRGVYTFCMCPGGHVIAAASEPGGVVTNGMSFHARDAENSNAALLTGIRPEDFGDPHPLSGFDLQRRIEQAAYRAANPGRENVFSEEPDEYRVANPGRQDALSEEQAAYRAANRSQESSFSGEKNSGVSHPDFLSPAQRVEDFLSGRPTVRFGDVRPSYQPGVTPCDLKAVLPAFVIENLKEGITAMDRQLKGFALPDAVLTAPETRSSSPVRILRDSSGQSESIRGLYPVGEGAGYAGGIISAAVDGITAARAALENSH